MAAARLVGAAPERPGDVVAAICVEPISGDRCDASMVPPGALIATAPAGAGALSRDPANLAALRAAFAAADPAGATDALIFDISGAVAGRKVTRDALDSISTGARIALETQSGVDLDQEAVNLIRYQQAFQASARAIQVAQTLFDTLLAIR